MLEKFNQIYVQNQKKSKSIKFMLSINKIYVHQNKYNLKQIEQGKKFTLSGCDKIIPPVLTHFLPIVFPLLATSLVDNPL